MSPPERPVTGDCALSPRRTRTSPASSSSAGLVCSGSGSSASPSGSAEPKARGYSPRGDADAAWSVSAIGYRGSTTVTRRSGCSIRCAIEKKSYAVVQPAPHEPTGSRTQSQPRRLHARAAATEASSAMPRSSAADDGWPSTEWCRGGLRAHRRQRQVVLDPPRHAERRASACAGQRGSVDGGDVLMLVRGQAMNMVPSTANSIDPVPGMTISATFREC